MLENSVELQLGRHVATQNKIRSVGNVERVSSLNYARYCVYVAWNANLQNSNSSTPWVYIDDVDKPFVGY